MITVIHGDDIASSRKYFTGLRTQSSTSFDGVKLEISDLVQALEGGSFFNDEKTIFIDNLISKRKQSKELEEITAYLKKNDKNKIYIWEEKEILKTALGKLGKPDVKLFKIPKNIFLFLETISPNNSLSSIKMFHELIKNSEPEFVFAMIVRQFRILLAIKDLKSSEAIDEVKRLSDWQIRKISSQAGLFTIEKLKNVYKRIGEIDLGLKTGSLNLNITQAIDIFLLEI